MNPFQTTLALEEGRKSGALAAQAVADAAERRNPGWMQTAYAAFVAYARMHPDRGFTTDDVRRAATQVPPAQDERAWGAVALRAKRAKVVKANGYTLVAAQRACPKTLWQFNAFDSSKPAARSLEHAHGPSGSIPVESPASS